MNRLRENSIVTFSDPNLSYSYEGYSKFNNQFVFLGHIPNKKNFGLFVDGNGQINIFLVGDFMEMKESEIIEYFL